MTMVESKRGGCCEPEEHGWPAAVAGCKAREAWKRHGEREDDDFGRFWVTREMED